MRVVKDEARNRGTDNTSHRQTGQEQSDCLSLFTLAKPVGEIQQHSWRKTGLRNPNRKRMLYNSSTLRTSPARAAMIPHVMRMRAIQMRAPILCNRRLLGISK